MGVCWFGGGVWGWGFGGVKEGILVAGSLRRPLTIPTLMGSTRQGIIPVKEAVFTYRICLQGMVVGGVVVVVVLFMVVVDALNLGIFR